MKIGIVVYSQTGHTRLAAENLKEKLSAAGHEAKLEEVRVDGPASPGMKEFRFEALPETSGYDALAVGGPVHAFTLAPPLAACLEKLPSLEGKKVAGFVTKQLPFGWTGGKQAIARIASLCEARGARFIGGEVITWKKSMSPERISAFAERLSALLSGSADGK